MSPLRYKLLAFISALVIFSLGCGVTVNVNPTPAPEASETAVRAEKEIREKPTATAAAKAAEEKVEEATAEPSNQQTRDGNVPEANNPLWATCTAAGYTGDVVYDLVGHPGTGRISEEECTWATSEGKNSVGLVTFPEGAVITAHLWDEELDAPRSVAEIFIGDGEQYPLWGSATIRFWSGFKDHHGPRAKFTSIEDWACAIWDAENGNGEVQTFPFEVALGNFSCGDDTPSSTYPEVATFSCPTFGGQELNQLEDGGCHLPWDESRGVVSDTVPDSWKALWWDSNAEELVWTTAGETLEVGEATFYREE